MKLFLITFSAVLVAVTVSVVSAQPMNQSPLVNTRNLTDRATRACMFPPGGWTIINCSNVAAARSAQLNTWGRYIVQCGDDSYLSWGAVTIDADANDGWLPSGSWLSFFVRPDARYLSCLNKTADSDCRIVECL